MDIIRKLLYWISGLFFKVIPDLYGLLYDLAGAKLFQDDTIKSFSTNLYLLVSVVMLFVFGVQLIKAIVNPDLLTDNKKGTAAFVKRAVLSVVIITVIPIAFNALYTIQDKVIENSLIEKIVVGFEGDKNELDVGQYLSASLISELLYPEEDEKATFEDATALGTYYNNMLNNNVDGYYDLVGDYINEKYESSDGIKKYSMHYEALVMLVSGIIVCYILVTACMDMALRLVKLAMLELIAPISIIAYLIKGDDSLSKWVSEVVKTYAIVFLKLGTIAMVVFGFQQMQDMFDDQSKYAHPWIMRTLIMIGLLTLINELPNLIQSLFGVSFQFKGGVKGRLGNMFGPAGKIAQDTWGKVTGGLGKGAKGLGGLAVGGAALGAGLLAKGFDNKVLNGRGAETARAIKNSNFGRQTGRIAGTVGSTFRAGGGIKGAKEGYKAFKENPLTKDALLKRQRDIDDKAFEENAAKFGIDMSNKRSAALNAMPLPSKISGEGKTADQLRKEQLKLQQDRISVANDAVANIAANVRSLHLPKGVQEALIGSGENLGGYVKAAQTKKIVDEIKNARDNVSNGASKLVTDLTNSGDSRRIAAADELKSLDTKYKKGDITSSEYASRLKSDFIDKGLIDKTVAEESITKYIDQAQSLVNNNIPLLAEAAKMANVDLAKPGADGQPNYDKIMGSTLGIMSGNVDKKYDVASSVYENAKKEIEGSAVLKRDVGDTESNIGRVLDDYVLETKGNKFDANSAATILNQTTNVNNNHQQTSQSQASTNGGYGPEYYPNSYDDFYNYNSQPRAPRPESTGTGTPQPEPTPISNASTPASDNSTPERVVERETIRETNNQNNGPTTLDNVTINASDINAQNLSAQNVNAQGFNANSVDNGHLDQLGLNQEDAIAEQQSDKIVEAIEELNDTIEESNKKNNE